MPEGSTTRRGPEHGPAEMQAGRLSVAELLRREDRTDEPLAGRSGGSYRLLALAASVALLCAGGVATTAALAGPRIERAMPEDSVLEHITGPGALRPDLINTTIDPMPAEQPSSPQAPGSYSAPPEPTGTPPPGGRSLPPDGATGSESGPAEDGEPPGGSAAAGTGERTEPSAEPVSDRLRDTVTSFYQLVVTDPDDAYALLGSDMRGSGYPAFAASWSDVERVTVDSIQSDGHDAAVVTVVVERVDGSVLRSVQRVVVASTGSPRIESARLLSASAS